jgi:beta-galactosidase
MYFRNFDESQRQAMPEAQKQDPSSPADWENPEVISRRKRSPHTPLRSFTSSQAALNYWKGQTQQQTETTTTTQIFYLTGDVGEPDIDKQWRFCLLGSPESTPKDWQRIDFAAASQWDRIALPNHWQCQGYDTPIYTNTGYPFRFDPPLVRRDGNWKATDCDLFLGGCPPETRVIEDLGPNATGLYRTSLTLPSSWSISDSRIFLVFEGVDSALEVWLDGAFVGYSQDSCLPAEFDVTEILQEHSGRVEHVLCCRVSLMTFVSLSRPPSPRFDCPFR